MKIKLLHPLISCICITNKRKNFLLKTILSFDQQNYPNLELIVCYPEDDLETKSLLDKLKMFDDLQVVGIERDSDSTIGSARNLAVAQCKGLFICLWDDDDHHFFSRVADQYNRLQGNGRYYQASVLKQIILFDSVQNQAYISEDHLWAGTLLCRKDHVLKYPFLNTNVNECQPILNFLTGNNLVMTDDLEPSLYTFVYHGDNLSTYDFFLTCTSTAKKLDQHYSDFVSKQVQQRVSLELPC